MTDAVVIRRATVDDIAVVARHRAAMFLEMGQLHRSGVAPMVEETMTYLRDAVPRGEYVGWLACTADRLVVAGAGAQCRRVLPFARPGLTGAEAVGFGRQAIVLNVYTEPAFRRHGLARALMLESARLGAVVGAREPGAACHPRRAATLRGARLRTDQRDAVRGRAAPVGAPGAAGLIRPGRPVAAAPSAMHRV